MRIELTKDDRDRFNDESGALHRLNNGALIRVVGRPDYFAEWDETVAPAPSQADINQAIIDAKKNRLKRVALETADSKASQTDAQAVMDDIDSGVLADEEAVRLSGKYR